MNILLLNDNPVVTKLVTLSAQKTSDELEIVSSVDEIAQKPYDLFVLDDTFYSDDIISVVKAKTSFSSSLYICSRDAEEVSGFTRTLKKPFLPTDLVEMFAKVNIEIKSPSLEVQDSIEDEAEIVEIDSEDELDMSEMELEEIGEVEEVLEIDSLEDFEFDDELEDELEDISLDEDLLESVLDKDDVQEVQNLLDEVDIEFTYDIDKVAGELSFSPDALKEFLEDFIAQAEEFKGQLYGALDLSDYETLHSIAHKLKGVAANLSVTEAFDSLVVVNQSEDSDEIKIALDKYYVIISKLNEFIHNTEAETIEENSSDTVLDAEELEDFNDEVLEFDELEEVDEELEIKEEIAEDIIEEEVAEVSEPEEDVEEDMLDMDDEELVEALEPEEELELEEELKEEVSEPEEELELDEDVEVEKEIEEEKIEDEAVEEVEETEELEPEEELNIEDELDMSEMELEAEVEESEEELESDYQEPDLETQIESAVSELSEDDLASELDADSILDISVDDVDGLDALDGMNGLDTLTSADIKSAIGEEDTQEVQTLEEPSEEVTDNDGVEALKTLLTALSDKNVAASLKGMTININITLGNK